jgi:3D (Asp-Asp-Asp) domain-containing protein
VLGRKEKEELRVTLNPLVQRFTLLTVAAICGFTALGQNGSANPKDVDSNNTVTAAKALSSSVPAARKVTVREPIPYPTLRKATSQLRNGTSRTVQNGATGEKVIVYRVYSRADGVELRREKINSRTTKQPVPAIIEVGIQSALPSRGGYYGGSHRSLSMKATYYLPYSCGGAGTGRTATGLKAGFGVVAVDPGYIRLGTRLYIEGYGYAIAADTGGAIKGSRIDLCVDSRRDVKGMHSVRVWVLD